MNNLLKIITIVIFPISLNGQVDLINKVSNNGETDTKQFEFIASLMRPPLPSPPPPHLSTRPFPPAYLGRDGS